MGLTHQEPVDVHDREEQQQCVEEEIVWDVGHRPQAAVAGDVQNLKREPVEAEPEPEGRGQSSRLGRRKGRLPSCIPFPGCHSSTGIRLPWLSHFHHLCAASPTPSQLSTLFLPKPHSPHQTPAPPQSGLALVECKVLDPTYHPTKPTQSQAPPMHGSTQVSHTLLFPGPAHSPLSHAPLTSRSRS